MIVKYSLMLRMSEAEGRCVLRSYKYIPESIPAQIRLVARGAWVV